MMTQKCLFLSLWFTYRNCWPLPAFVMTVIVMLIVILEVITIIVIVIVPAVVVIV